MLENQREPVCFQTVPCSVMFCQFEVTVRALSHSQVCVHGQVV